MVSASTGSSITVLLPSPSYVNEVTPPFSFVVVQGLGVAVVRGFDGIEVGIELLGDVALRVIGKLADSIDLIDRDSRQAVRVEVVGHDVAERIDRDAGHSEPVPVGAERRDVAVGISVGSGRLRRSSIAAAGLPDVPVFVQPCS